MNPESPLEAMKPWGHGAILGPWRALGDH